MHRHGLPLHVRFGMAALAGAIAMPLLAADVPTQHVSLVAPRNGQVELRYAFEGGRLQRVSGLGVRIHYDPTCVRVLRVHDVETSGLVGLDTTPQADAGDADGDPLTTRLMQVAWLDLRGAWLAGQPAPRALLVLDVQPLACARGASDLRVSGTGTAPGVRLQAVPLRLPAPDAR